MKYFNITSLQASINRIVQGNITQEHRTSTATLGLCRHYFPVQKFSITAEQIQEISNKKPDFTIEKFVPINSSFYIHTYVEVKSLINSNIPNIVEQLFNTIHETLDFYGNTTNNYSSFIIAMKGTKIAFYMYHNFSSLLDDYGIPNYKGFIPLTYKIPEENLLDINRTPLLGIAYHGRINFNTDSAILTELGVLGTNNITHPHVFDLLNINHREDIHKIFTFIADSNPNLIFSD